MDDRDLKGLLERAAAGVEPRTGSRSTVLRRARRKRVVNAVLAGTMAVVIVAGGGLGALRLTRADDGRRDLAAGNEAAVEVASGTTEGRGWVVSFADVKYDYCLTLTVEGSPESAAATTCERVPRTLHVTQVRSGNDVVVAGTVAPEVDAVEILIEGFGTRSGYGVKLSDSAALPDGRRFFVDVLPYRALFARAMAYLDEGQPMMHQIDVKGVREFICTVTSGEGDDDRDDGSKGRDKDCNGKMKGGVLEGVDTATEVIEAEEKSGN